MGLIVSKRYEKREKGMRLIRQKEIRNEVVGRKKPRGSEKNRELVIRFRKSCGRKGVACPCVRESVGAN